MSYITILSGRVFANVKREHIIYVFNSHPVCLNGVGNTKITKTENLMKIFMKIY
jgi:hypothetical protein